MVRKELLKGDRYGEREVFLPVGLYPDIGWMCNRAWKCLAFPLYCGKIWRGGIRISLFIFSAHTGITHCGNGICGRAGKPEECGIVI